MCRLWLLLAFIIFPALVCKADSSAVNSLSNLEIHPGLLAKNKLSNLSSSRDVKLQYGFSQMQISGSYPRNLKIDHQQQDLQDGSMFLGIKTAEAGQAAEDFTIKDFENIINAVNKANELQELKPFLSREYYKVLQDKVEAESSQYMVLAMLQGLRPSNIYILDFSIKVDQAQILVKGQSHFGSVKGMIHLIKQDGLWKIEHEDWYTKDINNYAFLGATQLSQANYREARPQGIIAQISPDSRINGNFLSLTRVPYHKSGRAFTFVFLLKKNKTNPVGSNEVFEKVKAAHAKSNPRTHVHVLWTGSKKIMKEQQVVEDRYPIDFSIANYDDGYSSGQWNLILPNKKPREVVVSLLWNF